MYDYYSDDYYSDEYSDEYEYTTVDRYDYELNHAGMKVVESPLEKLYNCIKGNEVTQFIELLPDLIEYVKDAGQDEKVLERGDEMCNDIENEVDDTSDNEENDDFMVNGTSKKPYLKVKEIYFSNGETLLIAAASKANPEIVSHIISKGFNVNEKLKNTCRTALLALTMSKPPTWNEKKSESNWINDGVKCLRILIENGADPEVKSFESGVEYYGNTVLHYAALNNRWKFLEILLHTKADVNAMNNNRQTPLMLAASKGYLACCNLLLMNGADPNLTDKNGNTSANLAEFGSFYVLAESLNILTDVAQNDFRLYKLWNEYSEHKDSSSICKNYSNVSEDDTIDKMSYNHSCIESFCLSLNAPYLVKLMEDEGLSVSDLKSMDEENLLKLGISSNDSLKIVSTLKDVSKKPKISEEKISMEFGNPLKLWSLLEMGGNMGEHLEFVENAMEMLENHMERNQQFYQEHFQIVNRDSISEMKMYSSKSEITSDNLMKSCRDVKKTLIEMLEVPDEKLQISTDKNEMNKSLPNFSKYQKSTMLLSVVAAAVSLGAVIMYRSWR